MMNTIVIPGFLASVAVQSGCLLAEVTHHGDWGWGLYNATFIGFGLLMSTMACCRADRKRSP